ncbi:MAG: hypothetical protein GY862_39280 [Gammaproteobacteria bacterium]|nr:hypothetical protein [Gammaproteobacteria bacterium]
MKSGASGRAGNITLEANRVELQQGSQIATLTMGTGKAGDIHLKAAESVGIAGWGSMKTVKLRSGLETSTYNSGEAGKITVETPTLTVREQGMISAFTLGFGNAGQVELAVDTLSLSDGAMVNLGTSFLPGTGKAGTLKITANQGIAISGNSIIASNVFNQAEAGGSIEIFTPELEMQHGKIQARSQGRGKAGNITLDIGKLEMSDSEISTDTKGAGGGEIRLNSFGYVYLKQGSELTTSAEDRSGRIGSGGYVDLQSAFIVLDGGKILAQAEGGTGGRIHIGTAGIYNFKDMLSRNLREYINADSQTGIDGIVEIESPENNQEGSVTEPNMTLISMPGLARCESGSRFAGGNSFAYSAGGMPDTPGRPRGMIPVGQ